MSPNITEVSPDLLVGIPSSGSWNASGGRVDAGTIYPANDGSRLLTHIIGTNAYFIQTEHPKEAWKVGKVHTQSVFYFSSDVGRGATGASLGKRLAGTKSVISNFLDIYMGCLTVAGGPTAYAITGMNLLVAGGTIKQNYDRYREALDAFVSDDMALRKMMPYFFDIMFCELYLGRIESDLTGKTKEVITNLIAKRVVRGEAAQKVLGKTIGVFVGKVGEDAMKRTLKGISGIIHDVLMKVIDHVNAGKPLTEEQIELLSQHHFVPKYKAMSWAPAAMDEQRELDRGKEVIREAARNAQSVRMRLARIARAVDLLAG